MPASVCPNLKCGWIGVFTGMDSLLGVTAQPKKKYSPLWSSAIDHKFILGVNYGIVKGGHMESLGSDGESLDLLFDGGGLSNWVYRGSTRQAITEPVARQLLRLERVRH